VTLWSPRSGSLEFDLTPNSINLIDNCEGAYEIPTICNVSYHASIRGIIFVRESIRADKLPIRRYNQRDRSELIGYGTG
jgi:hypothetical protein